MKKTLILLLASLTLGTPAIHADDNEQPVIELRADRTFIYPQRMNLTGEESLLDILLMFPDQMQSGFEEMIGSYNLRIDNAPMNGNTRLLLSQLKANLISKVQICDNTAVAKGTVGLNRVIDVNLLRMEKGAHGFVGVQSGSDEMVAPSAQVLVGTENTDIFANASYTYQNKWEQKKNNQYLTFHMTNWFSKRDRLLTYVTQQYLDNHDNRDYSCNQTYKTTTQKYLGRARYFHNFNDEGTELLLVGGYSYNDAPTTTYLPTDETVIGTKARSILGIVELNTPLFTKDLSMMLGWEGDWGYNTYHKEQTLQSAFEHDYMSSNSDIYLQFNYVKGPWRFTLGDRVMFFHYGVDGMKYNDTRNNWQASVIVKPSQNHQIQGGYFRKFSNPSYSVNGEISVDDWMDMQGKLVASYIDEYKLAYTYSRQNLSANVTSSYFVKENANNLCKTCASFHYQVGVLSLNAGANYYCVKDAANYATFLIDPSLSLPHQCQVGAKAIFFTSKAPLVRDERCYGELHVSKQLDKHFDLMAQWHDIFSGKYSAVLGSVQFRF